MPASHALAASLLRSLGHPVPSEDELDRAIKRAILEAKIENGEDPKQVKYKLVSIESDWIRSVGSE